MPKILKAKSVHVRVSVCGVILTTVMLFHINKIAMQASQMSPFSPLLSHAQSLHSICQNFKNNFLISLPLLSLHLHARLARIPSLLSKPQNVFTPLRGPQGPCAGSVQTHPCSSPQACCSPTPPLVCPFPKQLPNT